MKNIIFTLLIFSVISCSNYTVTESEYSSVQKVLDFYGGECIRSKGEVIKNGKHESYFELEVRDSELLNLNSKNLKFHSANIAYLFHSNLGKDDKLFDEIKVKIDLKNDRIYDFSYSSQVLYKIQEFEPIFNKLMDQIKHRRYNKLLTSFDKTVDIDLKSIKNLFMSIEHQYGPINKTQFQGFEIKKAKKFGEAIVIKEAISFKDTSISMIIVYKESNLKILAIEFE